MSLRLQVGSNSDASYDIMLFSVPCPSPSVVDGFGDMLSGVQAAADSAAKNVIKYLIGLK